MDQQTFIGLLLTGISVLGTALIAALLWFVRRAVAQSDRQRAVVRRILQRLLIVELRAGIRTMNPDDTQNLDVEDL
jgi:hypothetical protein